MPSYTINEPHPTVAQNSYIHSGRGGAGNTFRVATATTSPSGVPTKATSTPTTDRFYSGRGGAGNAHSASERHALSFDEEYTEAARHANASPGHVGRGGAGNIWSGGSSSKKSETASTRRDSSSTSGSERSGLWNRLSLGSRH